MNTLFQYIRIIRCFSVRSDRILPFGPIGVQGKTASFLQCELSPQIFSPACVLLQNIFPRKHRREWKNPKT